jgi:hypothetical protein
MLRKEKERKVHLMKRSLKRHKASNRFFLDQDTMGEARWAEAVEYSIAKREGRKIDGVKYSVWYCPCGCITAYGNKVSDAKLVKQPKSQRKPKSEISQKYDRCIHFGS